MTRGRLTRILLIPAALIAAGIAILLIYPQPSQTSPDTSICTQSDTAQAPSGRPLALCNTLSELQPSGDTWSVIRATDPDLPQGVADHTDHDWACTTWGLPTLDTDPRPTRIIVQIMAQPFPRGEPAPGITQSIEAYSVADGTCQWELL